MSTEPRPSPDPPSADASADVVAERIFSMALAGAESLSVYVGDRLGWYRSLATDGPATPAELARRTGTHERYAREWLEQQAVCGILLAHDGVDTDGGRRFEIPAGAAEALTDESSLAYLGPLPRMFAAAAQHLPELLDAYRTGGGVSWEVLGDDAREAQAALNRPWFEHRLGDALASVPEVDEALRRPGARILDLGCGAGWSSIALAHAYPAATVEGVDVDAPSVETARRHAASSGLGERVGFRTADAGSLGSEAYDAAFAFECVHDMSRPVEVLSAVRRAVRPEGFLVVVDEAVAEEFTSPGDDLERFMYACSIFVCLPDGMSSAPSAGTGTVMRSETLRSYAREAGFDSLDVLPIEDFSFFRFYRLR
jgi:2-polyprenyl-3-methyl-5-hydroxy-6-metoxy-1,4-benzoquinol methylase